MCRPRTSLPCIIPLFFSVTLGEAYPLRWWRAMQLRFSMGVWPSVPRPAEFNGCRPEHQADHERRDLKTTNSKSLFATCFNSCNPITRDLFGDGRACVSIVVRGNPNLRYIYYHRTLLGATSDSRVDERDQPIIGKPGGRKDQKIRDRRPITTLSGGEQTESALVKISWPIGRDGDATKTRDIIRRTGLAVATHRN